MAGGAFEGQEPHTALELDLSDKGHSMMHTCFTELAKHDIVQEHSREGSRRAWTITQCGAASIDISMKLFNPRSVCEPRVAVSYFDNTLHELVSHLRADGWECRVSNSGTSTKGIEDFNDVNLAGKSPSPKVMWFLPERLPLKQYLLCLAFASDLARAGVKDWLCQIISSPAWLAWHFFPLGEFWLEPLSDSMPTLFCLGGVFFFWSALHVCARDLAKRSRRKLRLTNRANLYSLALAETPRTYLTFRTYLCIRVSYRKLGSYLARQSTHGWL